MSLREVLLQPRLHCTRHHYAARLQTRIDHVRQASDQDRSRASGALEEGVAQRSTAPTQTVLYKTSRASQINSQRSIDLQERGARDGRRERNLMATNDDDNTNAAAWQNFITQRTVTTTPTQPRQSAWNRFSRIRGRRQNPIGPLERAVRPTTERRQGLIFLYPLGDTLGMRQTPIGRVPTPTWSFSEFAPDNFVFMVLTRGTIYEDDTIRAEQWATMDSNFECR